MCNSKLIARRLFTGLLLAVSLPALLACQKKCNQPVAERFKFLSDTPWRLVSSTDPSVKGKVTKYDFLIFNFGVDFSGDIQKVDKNREPENPVLVFQWDVDTDAEILTMNKQVADQGNTGDGTTTPGKPPANATVDRYRYDLGKELELWDTRKGFYFRLVPYQGIVAPDDNCTFE